MMKNYVTMLNLFWLLLCALILNSTQASTVRNVCKTEDCKRSAKNLKTCMNETVSPCENFYQYACGNFENMLNENDSSGDFFALVQNKIIEYGKKVLNDKKKHASKAVETAKKFYKSCLNGDEMNKKGLAPLKDLLHAVGLSSTKTPLSSPSKRFDWVKSAAKMKKFLNFDFLIAVDVLPDPKNRSVNLISVAKPSEYTGSGPDYSNYLKKRGTNYKSAGPNEESSSLGEELFHYIKGASNIFDQSSKKKTKSQKRKLKKAINNLSLFVFERLFLQLKNRPDDTPVPQLLTLDELQNFTNSALIGLYDGKFVLDWKKYITTLFQDTDVNLDLSSGADKISVSDMMYLKEVLQLIEQDHHILESAIWWDVIQNFGSLTIDEFRKLDLTYRKDGMEYTGDETDICHGIVRKHFSFALAHTFLGDPEISENRQRTTEMLDNVKLGFDEVIEKAKWMDSQTKAVAREKASVMRKYVSFPDWLYNVTAVDEYFEDMDIFPKDFLKTVLLLEQTSVRENLKSLREINDLEAETYNAYPLMTNAFYSASDNTMMVPMGIVQFPFIGHPIQAMNYGALGTILGHEITHGFDTEGKRHDQLGNIRRWWKNETLEEYKKRSSCFVESYNKIEIGGENVDGILTLDENIADNGGLKEALIGYQRYVKTHSQEPILEGFENFTHEQLFILSFANIWCSVSSQVSDIDQHSPDEARVIGVLKNSHEFQKIWKCEKGTPMNPEEKCEIW